MALIISTVLLLNYATREVAEETGTSCGSYAVIDQLGSVVEIKGSNNFIYITEALQRFRVYDVEKRTLISRLDNALAHHMFDQESVVQGPPGGVLDAPAHPVLDQPLGVGDGP